MYRGVVNGMESDGQMHSSRENTYMCDVKRVVKPELAYTGFASRYPNATTLGIEGTIYLSYTSWIYINDARFTDLETAKAILSANPVDVCIVAETETVTDITDLFTDDNFLKVEGGGSIVAVNEYEYAVPHKETYAIDLKEANANV